MVRSFWKVWSLVYHAVSISLCVSSQNGALPPGHPEGGSEGPVRGRPKSTGPSSNWRKVGCWGAARCPVAPRSCVFFPGGLCHHARSGVSAWPSWVGNRSRAWTVARSSFLGGESQLAQLGGKVVWFPLCALGRPTVQGPWPHLAPQSEKPIWGRGVGGHQTASTRQVV